MTRTVRGIHLIFVLFSVFLSISMAIKCYSCAGCDTVNANTPTVTNQSSIDGACFKSVTNLFGITYVIRDYTDVCFQVTSNEVNLYCCSIDLCNGASQLSIFKWIFILLMTIVKIISTY